MNDLFGFVLSFAGRHLNIETWKQVNNSSYEMCVCVCFSSDAGGISVLQ